MYEFIEKTICSHIVNQDDLISACLVECHSVLVRVCLWLLFNVLHFLRCHDISLQMLHNFAVTVTQPPVSSLESPTLCCLE